MPAVVPSLCTGEVGRQSDETAPCAEAQLLSLWRDGAVWLLPAAAAALGTLVRPSAPLDTP